MDRDAEVWIRAHVEPIGDIETVHQRSWATVARVPSIDGPAWFKACAPVQAFEPRLTAQLFARWPDRVAQVLAFDEERAWLLMAHAGTPIAQLGNPGARVEYEPTSGGSIAERWLIAITAPPSRGRREVPYA